MNPELSVVSFNSLVFRSCCVPLVDLLGYLLHTVAETQAEGDFTILQLHHLEHLVPGVATKEERKMEDISAF